MLTTTQILNPAEKDDFLNRHMRHRLTLLRTLRERKKSGHNFQGQGDIERCVRDSNLIMVRLILDFLGLKGECEGTDFKLIKRKPQTGKKYKDDVMIDQFAFGRLLEPTDVPVLSNRLLAGVCCRADKELAHLTNTFNEEFNTDDNLIKAATAVEDLLLTFLYAPEGKQLPEMDI